MLLDDEIPFHELTARTGNALRRDSIFTFRQLIQQTESQLLRAPNFGRISLNEIKGLILQYGWHLGTPSEEMTGAPATDAEFIAGDYS